MSDLQVGLLVIGVLVVLAVIAFNRWQERAYRRQADTLFERPKNTTATPSTVRAEPKMREAPSQDAPAPSTVPPSAVVSHEPESPAISLPPPIDDAIYYVATLQFSEPVSWRRIRETLATLLLPEKDAVWYGMVPGSAWQRLDHRTNSELDSAELVALAAGLQLANRAGPIGINDVNALCDAFEALGAAHIGVVDCPDKQAALLRAASLDQFCAAVDIMIEFNIVAPDQTPFDGARLSEVTAKCGLTRTREGAYAFLNASGLPVFTLSNLDAQRFPEPLDETFSTYGIRIALDVPRAQGGIELVDQMYEFAGTIARFLGGKVVDDNRREFDANGVAHIRAQLGAVYALMEEREVIPGSERAQTLFA